VTHPIDPLPKLSDEQVGEWLIDDGYPWDSSELTVITITTNRLKNVAHKAAQWGADQELEACCKWLRSKDILEPAIDALRAARRPKPPSLKEQALDELHISFDKGYLKEGAADIIRRALEQLPDCE
jgi:hypothetical protein